MRVLRAYPQDQLELRPHPTCKTARELAWVFVLERGLARRVYHNEFAKGVALETAHKELGDIVRAAGDAELS
jgi:hypothetical protein